MYFISTQIWKTFQLNVPFVMTELVQDQNPAVWKPRTIIQLLALNSNIFQIAKVARCQI